MTIHPITPTSATNMSKQTPYSGADTKEKKPRQTGENIEWYCNDCNKYFKVPDPVKYKFHPIKGAVECTVPNCPFCGSEHIINNRENKSEENLWTRII